MSMYIEDGRRAFYQWDLDRKIAVTNKAITELHFYNGTTEKALVCEVTDGKADVPNILLQTAGDLFVYGFAEDHTKISKVYKIYSRLQPENYIYSETEILRYETLAKEIENLKQAMKDIGSSEDIEEAVRKYLENHPANVEDGGYYIPVLTKEGVLEWRASKENMPAVDSAKIKGEPGKDGVDGKDAIVDPTLQNEGQAADAKAVGEAISQLSETLKAIKGITVNGIAPDANGNIVLPVYGGEVADA